MLNFEDVLAQYEPMISACIRQLNIYRQHEHFRQAGRVALWQAWQRFDAEKGDFAPYAYRCIRGAMMDELKKEGRFDAHYMPAEDDKLTFWIDEAEVEELENERNGSLYEAVRELTEDEFKLLQWLFVERFTRAECAERFGISVPAVKKRRERLLKKLREGMEGE